MHGPSEGAPIPRPALALLDLDGTLVDSVHDVAVAATLMMRGLGREPPEQGRLRRYMGDGIERFVHRCLTASMHADAPPRQLERALALFLELYATHNGRHSRVYDGVRAGLAQLQGMGARLACVTNKAARFSEPLLARFALLDVFELVVSGDTVAQKKPDPAPLLHAAARLGVAPASALLIGDSVNDVRAARAAGMRVVCVSYGYNQGRDLRHHGAEAVLDSLAELAGLLARGEGA